MRKSKVSGTREPSIHEEQQSSRSVDLGSQKRIDPPHDTEGVAAESPMPLPADEPADEQVRLQADQLAVLLRNRQKELDHREAELNSRIARLDSDTRAARLWLSQRETELAARTEELAKREEALREQEEALHKQEEEQAKHSTVQPDQLWQAETSAAQQMELLRRRQIENADRQLAETQAEIEKLREQLLSQQRSLTDETAVLREKMAAEHRAAMDDLEHKRKTVQRRADQVDRSRAALKQLRSELGRMHRETLEIRLATEELWIQLSGAAPPAALTRSLGRIRSKLAEQYREANAELIEERKELEAIREQLTKQHETLMKQKRRFERWVGGCQEECQQQASRLIAREEQVHREEIQFQEQTRYWQEERLKYQLQLRQLRAKTAGREEATTSA